MYYNTIHYIIKKTKKTKYLINYKYYNTSQHTTIYTANYNIYTANYIYI